MFETISYITLPKKTKNWKIIWFQKRPPDTFCRKRCSRKFCKVHRKTPMFESLFNKVADLFSLATLLKRDSPTCFFLCAICEFFKNTYFEEHLRTIDCFSDVKHVIRVFNTFFSYFMCFSPIFKFLFICLCENYDIKVQTVSLVLNVF